jgi:hypothetical protein
MLHMLYMLQVFLKACYKPLFEMFHLFQTYVASVCVGSLESLEGVNRPVKIYLKQMSVLTAALLP